MATLEKIRSKSVFLIVVIGIALLAFIVGDAITNGRNLFGSGSTVAEVDGVKVDIAEYQDQLNKLQEAMQAQGQDVDQQLLSEYALESILNQKLMARAAERLGINVSDEQVTYYIMTNPQKPMQDFISTYGRQLGTLLAQEGKISPETQLTPQVVYSFVFTPEKYGLTEDQVLGAKKAWMQMEKETRETIAQILYMNLLTSAYKPNALELDDLYAMQNGSATVDVARKPFGTLDEKKYPVSDAEIQAEYDKRKAAYRVLEPTRTVAFVAQNITPSAEDVKAANSLKEQTLKAMRAGQQPGKDLTKEGVRYDRRTAAASAADPQIASFLKSAPVDSLGVFDRGGSFHIVRVVATTAANDSVEIIPFYAATDVADQVKERIRAGVSADSLSTLFPQKAQASAAQWQRLQNPASRQGMPPAALAALDSVSAGSFVTIETSDEGSAIAYVKSVRPKVTVYEYEDAYYDLYPSDDTVDAAREAFEKLAAANKDPKKFADAVKKAGYFYQTYAVNASTPAFQQGPQSYFPKSRDLVEWVMTEGETGAVSPVFSNDDKQQPVIYMAYVENEYDDFAPATDSRVRKELEARVRASKAGDAMVKQYSGKGSVEATAQAMGVTPVTDEQVRFFGSMNVQDPAVAAAISGTQPGSKVYVVKGQDGVYTYVVKAQNKPEGIRLDQQLRQTYQRALNPVSLLRGRMPVDNNIFKLTRSH